MGSFTNAFSNGVFLQGSNLNLNGSPSNLILSVLSDTSIKLDWTNGSTNQTGHVIERSINGFDYTLASTVFGVTSTFTDTVIAGELYYYRVKAFIGIKYSDYSNVASDATYPSDKILWLDASQITGKNDDDLLSSWVAGSGTSFTAAQATSTRQPKFKTGILGGKPIVRFSKARTDMLTVPNNAILNIKDPSTLIVVAINRDISAIARILYKGGSYGFGVESTGKVIFTTNGIKDYVSTKTPWVNDIPTISAVTFGNDYDVKAYINGCPYETISGTSDANVSSNDLQIGGNTAQYLEGDIAEIIQYNKVLSASELQAISVRLNRKWGINIGLGNPDLLSTTNAEDYLITPTYDGSGKAIHPSIVYNANKWNGFKYWLGITPFPNENSTYENPSILVSNDGLIWDVPIGLTNPIAATPVGGYNSDVELFFSSDNVTLYCLYREIIGSNEKIWIKSSIDGTTWSSPTLILSGSSLTNYISPSVVWNGIKYNMWVNDSASGQGLSVYESIDPISGWTLKSRCAFTGSEVLSHLDVNYEDGCYYIFGMSGDKTKNICGVSIDGVSFVAKIIINASISGWDQLLYRSTALKMTDGWHLWYSGAIGLTWHIGHTKIDSV